MSARLDQEAGPVPGGLRAPAAVPPVRQDQARGLRRRLADVRLEHIVMGAAIVALCILVVMPLLSLFIGSFYMAQGVYLYLMR